MRRGNAGYIRQQTVNCDYISCSKTANVTKVTAENIEVNNIVSPTIDELNNVLRTIRQDIADLKSQMQSLINQATATYTAGSTVASTLHFDDVDLTDPNFNIESYQLELRERLAFEAGVPLDQIVIVDLASTGSATARVEIKFPETDDPIANEALTAKKNEFIQKLNDPSGISDILGDDLGDVQVISVNEGEIRSLNSKLFALESKLHDFSLEDVKSLRLDTYKFEVDGDTLNIVRYDHEVGDFVGGTLNIDY